MNPRDAAVIPPATPSPVQQRDYYSWQDFSLHAGASNNSQIQGLFFNITNISQGKVDKQCLE